MKFIDLSAQQHRIRQSIETRIRRVLDHGQYVMGPELEELESTLARYVGVKHALACSSGTDALLLALMAYGVGPGDAVFTTPFTFMATAEAIALVGATPVFVDIDPLTMNLDPRLLQTAWEALKDENPSLYPLPTRPRGLRLKPRGIVAVDLFGTTADYDPINRFALSRDLFVVEDGAQSFGATYRGRRACSLAHVGCTSFFPAKPLGAYGDGGMCFTDDDLLKEHMVSLRVHGQGTDKYENVRVGLNARMDTLQAAVLLSKFEIFEDELNSRQRVAKFYHELLEPLGDTLRLPSFPSDGQSAWAQYSVLAKNAGTRTLLLEELSREGIPTAVYYPTPLHLQPAFAFLGYRSGDFPVSEDIAQRIFSLLMHPYLEKTDQEKIAAALASSLRKAGGGRASVALDRT